MPGILIAVINYVQSVACKARETVPLSDLVSSQSGLIKFRNFYISPMKLLTIFFKRISAANI